ncbi:MAG: ankyrin repeat domain-containing protein [Phycisphaerales bacterium]|nr:ankyrin repeat domain-containing protein [Phycisphaerales bacterium]
MSECTDPLRKETPENAREEPLLHRAARRGDRDAIERLIAGGADPNARYRDRTPLMTAAASGDGATAETVRVLLALGADPALLRQGESAAIYACCVHEWFNRTGGDAARLTLLLDAGAAIPLSGRTAARLVATVAETGDVDRLRVLLDRGLPVNPVWDADSAAQEHRRMMERTKDHKATLMAQLEAMGMPEEFRSVAENVGSKFEKPAEAPSHFEIPLFQAASSGSAACVRLLIECGAQVDVRDDGRRTAMYYASSLEIVKLLMHHGLSLEESDDLGWSPLRSAVSDGELGLDRVRALIAAGADVNETDDRGYTIFMSAVASSDRDLRVMRTLVEAGADFRAVTELGWNAFHAAIDVSGEATEATSVRDTLGYLKELGVNIEQKNHLGETPLAKAVFLGYGIEVRVLCELGADPNAVGSSHWCCGGECGPPRPLLFYVADGQIDADVKAEALLAAGADPLAVDENGYRPIDHAVARLCAHAADYDQAYEHFYTRIPRPRLPRALQNDRSAFIAAIRPILSEYVESFARSIDTAIDAGGGQPSEKNRELYNTVVVLAAYEMWARLQMTQ